MNLLAEDVYINWQTTIFAIVGGLGIFLYGINLMGDSLKALAGTKLKLIIEKTTNTPIKGIFVGIIITGLIQSSSGTTALAVGLVRAGLMSLPQAIGIIIGANIGTTVTSFLIGLPIKEYALPIMATGSFLIFFINTKRYKRLGGAILGFGMLFFGLDIMGGALNELVQLEEFANALAAVGDIPVLGLFVGTITTAIVQSSSATIGILQGLYTTNAIPLIGAIAILLGSNIGTTVTAIIASIGGSVAAKRTAAAHVFFNVIGSVLFMFVLGAYTNLIQLIQDRFLGGENVELTIFFAHFGFNLFNTVIMYFFINQLVFVVSKIIKDDSSTICLEIDTLHEELIAESPVLALEAAKLVVLNMGRLTQQMFDYAVNYSFENNKRDFENGIQIEEILDTIDKKSHDYLVKIAQFGLNEKAAQLQASYVDTIRDFERIGDHCTNILEFFEYRYEDKIELSEQAKNDLTRLYDIVKEMISFTLEAFKSQDKVIALKVTEREDIVDELVIRNRKRHIKRINDLEASEITDGLYVDILTNVERIADHCNNIVINILQENYYIDDMDDESY